MTAVMHYEWRDPSWRRTAAVLRREAALNESSTPPKSLGTGLPPRGLPPRGLPQRELPGESARDTHRLLSALEPPLLGSALEKSVLMPSVLARRLVKRGGDSLPSEGELRPRGWPVAC